MAQAVCQKLAQDAGMSGYFRFDSAGTHTHHSGERPDPRAESALTRRGYNAGRIRSRRLVASDFEKYDLILAMDSVNLADITQQCPLEHQKKLRLLLEFSDGLDESDVPDPYYGNAQGFDRVLDMCEAGGKGLIQHLRVGL